MGVEKDTSMPHYRTPLIERLEELRKEGYKDDFTVKNGKLVHTGTNDTYTAEEVKIVNYHRFEGISDPDDMAILYIIETSDGHKGTVLDAYGTYSDGDLEDFMKKVLNKVAQTYKGYSGT